jgi:hypothetical protein
MCACTETDVRESANDCILASGEGHGSRGETLHPICAARPVSSSSECSVVYNFTTNFQPLVVLPFNKHLLSLLTNLFYRKINYTHNEHF